MNKYALSGWKWMRLDVILTAILLALITLLCVKYVHAQEPVKIGKYQAGPQLVFVVDHSSNGQKVVIGKEIVPLMSFIDVEDAHTAPLTDGTIMLCRQLLGYRDQTDTPRVGFSCGNDTYLAANLNFLSKDQAKKLRAFNEY